jgi:hypothetical protein
MWTKDFVFGVPRFNLEVDVTINSRTCDLLKGRSMDISESGIACHSPKDGTPALSLTSLSSSIWDVPIRFLP